MQELEPPHAVALTIVETSGTNRDAAADDDDDDNESTETIRVWKSWLWALRRQQPKSKKMPVLGTVWYGLCARQGMLPATPPSQQVYCFLIPIPWKQLLNCQDHKGDLTILASYPVLIGGR